jgi:phosphoribosyl 1,2-cyclic phosphodiesterase
MWRVNRTGEDFYIGRVGVTPFEIPHDAREPVGYALCCDGAKLCVATDLGCVKETGCANWSRPTPCCWNPTTM